MMHSGHAFTIHSADGEVMDCSMARLQEDLRLSHAALLEAAKSGDSVKIKAAVTEGESMLSRLRAADPTDVIIP